MPCSDSTMPWDGIADINKLENRVKRLEEGGVNNMSRMDSLLCSACRALKRMGYDFGENPLLDEWWHQHQIEDEAKQSSALAKCPDEDK